MGPIPDVEELLARHRVRDAIDGVSAICGGLGLRTPDGEASVPVSCEVSDDGGPPAERLMDAFQRPGALQRAKRRFTEKVIRFGAITMGRAQADPVEGMRLGRKKPAKG